MKVHICYIVSSLVNEGPVKVMLNTIRHLDFSRFEVSLITLKDEQKDSLLGDFKVFPIRLYSLGIDNSFFKTFSVYKSLRRAILKIKPDVTHTHCPRSLILTSFIEGGFKKVHTIHNYPGVVDRALYGVLKGTLVEFLMRIRLKRIDQRISCATNLQVLLQNNLSLDSVAIRNGIDYDLFVGGRDEVLRMKEQLGFNPNTICFIFVGRFSNEKNPLALVKLFGSEDLLDYQLLMLGEGPLLNEAQRIATPNIRFVGFRNNVRDYLVASDVFISSSLTEGMPNSVLEAMSVGLPLVLSNIPAHQEVLSCFGEGSGGIIIDLNNDEVVKRVKEFLSEIDLMSARDVAQDIFIRNFTAKRMSEAYQKQYLRLIEVN